MSAAVLRAASIAAGGEVFAHAVPQARRAGSNVAAVDGNFSTADKARLVRREEQDQIRAFLWSALPVHRYGNACGVGKGFAAAAVEAGVGDLSGMDRN